MGALRSVGSTGSSRSTGSELLSFTTSINMISLTLALVLVSIISPRDARFANFCKTAKFKCCGEQEVMEFMQPVVLRCFERSGCPGIFIHNDPCHPDSTPVDGNVDGKSDDTDSNESGPDYELAPVNVGGKKLLDRPAPDDYELIPVSSGGNKFVTWYPPASATSVQVQQICSSMLSSSLCANMRQY